MSNLAYSYIRFSSAEQAKGDSERRQIAMCEDYCRRMGLQLATGREYTFTDRGRSGYKSEHLNETGQLRRFLNLIEGGQIKPGSTLVIESLDRLGRQEVTDALEVFLSILRHDIKIVTLADGERVYEKGAHWGQLIVSIVEMSRAHGESNRKSGMIRKSMKNRQELARTLKLPIGAAVPLWLRLKPQWRDYATDGSAYEPIPERAAVVERIFSMTINGKGRVLIAKTLNAEGVPSFKGTAWGTSSVDKILKNRAVFGEYQPYSIQDSMTGKPEKSGDPIPGYFPAVVSEEIFLAALAHVDKRRTARATKQSTRFNVWQGVARCEHCGGALHLVNKGVPPKGRTYLHCSNARKGTCKGKAVRLDAAELIFRGLLVRIDALALVKDSSGVLAKKLDAVEGQLVGVRRHLAELEEQLAPGKRRSPTIGRAIEKAEEEEESLVQERERLQAELAAEEGIGWETFFERLDLVTPEGRYRANALLKRLGILVQIGPSGYLVMQDGEFLFAMDFREGEAGYLTRSAFGGGFPAFVPVSEVPDWAAAEDASLHSADAREDEGQRLSSLETAQLTFASPASLQASQAAEASLSDCASGVDSA